MKARATLIAILFLGILPVVAQAQYNYSFDYASSSSYLTIFRTSSFANVGHDAGETYAPISVKAINSAVYKQQGQEGWDWNTGFYDRDYRTPLDAGETVVIRNIYLWAGTLAPVGDLHFYHVYSPALDEGMTYTLRLVQIPTGIAYSGPTEWGPDHGTIALPFYATDNPLTGYKFEATITAPVPEPCTLASLAVPCVGLTGALFRLRKRRYTGIGSG